MQELRLLLCSTEWQKKDWRSHKLLCGAITQQPARPSENHARGISFPADREDPQLVWVSCHRVQDPRNADTILGIENPEVPRVLEVDQEAVEKEYLGDLGDIEHVRWNLHLQKVTPRLLLFYFRDNFYNDGSVPTASLARTVRPHGSDNRDWRGPLLVVAIAVAPSIHSFQDLERQGVTGGGKIELADVTLGDLCGVIDYSLGYKKGRNNLGKPWKDVSAEMEAMGVQSIILDLLQ